MRPNDNFYGKVETESVYKGEYEDFIACSFIRT